MSKTRKFSKALALLLMLALVLSVFPMTARATGGTITGTGTQSDPYIIADASDLATFRTNVNGGNSYSGEYVKLTADITTAQTAVIAPTSSNLFAGTFDGDGHTITVNLSGGTRTALFGYVTGTIKNLKVTGSVTSTGSNSGGIVGYLNGGSVLNCANDADVSATDGYSGGVVGYTGGTCTIDGCFNTGDISGGTRIGGVVGEQYYDVTVSNCYNMGNVTGTSTCNGGVVGYSRNAVTNCYHAVGTISTSYNNGSKGAIIGLMLSNNGSMVNCYYVATSNGLQASNSGDTGATVRTVDEMKAAAGSLGNYYMADTTPNINGGYPILYWQGNGSAPSGNIVTALNTHLQTNSNSFTIYASGRPLQQTATLKSGVTSISLTNYTASLQVDGTTVNAQTVWTSSNINAVAVPTAGYGNASVMHSDEGDITVTMNAYLKAVVDGVTYVSTDSVLYTLTIKKNLGPIVTYTVYVSVFNTNRNNPTVTGNNNRLMVAVPVTITGYANSICVDDALQQLHATYYSGGSNGYATSNGMITKLWGSTNNSAFGIYRNDVLTNVVTQEPVENGDTITVFPYMNTNSYNDRYLLFNQATMFVTAGSSNTSLDLNYKTNSNQTPFFSPLLANPTRTFYKLNNDGTLSSTSDVSYSSGNLVVQSTASGAYVVLGKVSTFSGARYVPAVARIVVTSSTSTEIVDLDKDALSIDTTIESYIDLPTFGENGSTISWASGDTSVITNDGMVIRPTGNNSASVTLTATIAYGGTTRTKTFNVTVTPQLQGSNYTSIMSNLASTVDAMLTDEDSFVDNMWLLLDRIVKNDGPSTTDRVTYHGYLDSYISATISGVTTETISAAQGSSNLAKAVILLKALQYDSYDTLYSTAMSNMQTYASAVIASIYDANSITEDEIEYLSTASFVLMAVLQENDSTLTTFRNTLCDFLTSNQASDGSWSEYTDTDAVVLTGLGLYRSISADTSVSTAISNSYTYLSGIQKANGSFGVNANSVIGNANTTAFVIIGLTAASYDPTLLKNNNRSVVDGLMMYYENGSFQYEGIADDLATEQSFRALLADQVFALNGNSIYNFSS